MARRPELESFARHHGLKVGTIADLIRYRLRNERSVERVKAQPVQTELGEFTLYAYEDRVSQEVHLALTRGKLRGDESPLVRVHVVDPLRDLLGIRAEPVAWTLRAAMERIARAGSGVIVILRDRHRPTTCWSRCERWRRRAMGRVSRMRRRRTRSAARWRSAADLWCGRADREGSRGAPDAGAVGAEANTRHLRVWSGD